MSGFSCEAALIDDVERRLVDKFADVPSDKISSVVAQAHQRFASSRVREFVPLLVERRAMRELSGRDTLSTAS